MSLTINNTVKQALSTLFYFFMLFISAAAYLFGKLLPSLPALVIALALISFKPSEVKGSSFISIKTTIQKTE